MNAQEYNLNIRVGYGFPQTVKISQDDVGRPLSFHLLDGSEALTIPSGATVTIHGTKPSGLGFSETCTVTGSTASIETTLEMSQEFGNCPAELVVAVGDDLIGTANFTMFVERSPHPENTIDGTFDVADSIFARMDDLEDELDEVKEDIAQLDGLSDDVKQAFLNCFAHVAWTDEHGQEYYDELELALYPQAVLSYITCEYIQSGVVYDTDTLNSLKTDLTVTAHYDDSTTQVVTAYTLTGTLTVGTSPITVNYGGKTTTFNVTVTDHRQVPTDYTWLYEASNGILLRNDSFITQTNTGTVEEKIENDLLYIKTTGNGTNSMYKLADTTTTDAVLSCRAKLLTSGYDASTDLDGRCFQLLLSDGSAGALANIWFLDDYIHVTTYYGNAEADIQKITTSALKDDFHIFELKVHNGVQSLDIDGQTVFSSSNLSAIYTTMNRIMVQNKKSVASSVQFDWIAYKEY